MNSAPLPSISDMVDHHVITTPITHIGQLMPCMRLLRFDRFLVTTSTTRDEPEHLVFLPPADHNRYRNGDASDRNTGLFSNRETG